MNLPIESARDLRRSNRLKVLRHIYSTAPVSRFALSQQVELSPATITNVVNELLLDGVITEIGSATTEVGRPRAMLTINTDAGFFIGIDLSETYIELALFDLMLTRQATITRCVSVEENQPHQIVEHIVQGLHDLQQNNAIHSEKILGVGISVPGIVDLATGTAVFSPNWGWHNVPLYTLLSEHLQFPLYLDNPLKVTAIAELWFGAGRSIDHMITLNLGTGVGAGIVINRMLYRGSINSAGEWGHTVVEPRGRLCRCGKRGCLEAYLGAPGILRHAHELAPHSYQLQPVDQMQALTNLLVDVERGDHVACTVMEITADYLALGLANLINLFNPQIIVLGGWAGVQLSPYLLADLPALIRKYALPQPAAATQLIVTTLPQNPVSLGAATMALEGFLSVLDKRKEVQAR